jgi:hypothetical protein
MLPDDHKFRPRLPSIPTETTDVGMINNQFSHGSAVKEWDWGGNLAIREIA